MTRRPRLALLRFLLVVFACAVADAKAADGPATKRMNLLFITADDMNADSPGWMGNSLDTTPSLDAFAATAHRFVNAHVTVPICMPGRSAFMTGLVPHRNGALGFDPVKPGTPTMVTVLKSAGYFTSVVDKHPHMKGDNEFPWDLKLSGGGKNPPLMRQHVKASIRAAADAGKPFFLNANITDPHRPFPGVAAKAGPRAAGKRKAAGEPAGDAAVRAAEPPSGGKVESAPMPVAATRPGLAGAVAGDFADNSSDAAVPANPQPPRFFTGEEVAIPSFLEDVPGLRVELAQYYSAMTRLDETFRSILSALKEAGHEDDTIVVFLSDHGISMPFAKATVYRHGTWSPILIRWPGMGVPQRREEFVNSIDLMPTLLELLQVKPPKRQDGRSLLPLLRGEAQEGRDHVVTHVNTTSSGKAFPQRCVRTADASLIFMSWPDGTEKFRVEAMNGKAFLAMLDGARENDRIAARVRQLLVGETLAYYDLRTDADERTNRINDPKHADAIDALAEKLLTHMKATGDPQTAAFERALGDRKQP